MALQLYTGQSHLVLARSESDFIVVERGSGRISPCTTAPPHSFLPVLRVHTLLGLVRDEGAAALVLVTERSVVAEVGGCDIHSIDAVKIVSISPLQTESPGFARVAKVSTTQLFTCGCYFASGYDLTRPFRLATGDQPSDPKYYWNREMYAELVESGVDASWFTPIIQGYVGSFTYSMPLAIQVTLISRRSCYMAGARYNARGVDDEGHVANFVESEQLLRFRNSTFSFLQIRGSVPVFWQQTGLLTAPIELARSEDSAAPAFSRHFRSLIAAYGQVMIINLLSRKRGESLLTQAFNAQIQRNWSELQPHVCKFEFDYKAECKHDRHWQVRSLVDQVHDMLTYYRFYAVGELACEQLGVPRINCLDCLDRTNVVMARLAWESLVLQLSLFQIPVLCDFDLTKAPDLMLKQFKRLWANNGDFLSKQYTGVGSVSSSVTREGKKGFAGIFTHGFRTVGRILSAANGHTQDNIDMVLPSTPRELEDKLHMIAVRVCSWNMSGETFPLLEDLQNWLVDSILACPHIVVVGVQQFESPRDLAERWNERVCGVLSQSGAIYKWVHTVSLQGCVLSLFAREALLPELQAVEGCVVKPGLKQALGGKGATLLRLSLHDVSLCFANCRLPSGVDRIEPRLKLLNKIHRKGFNGKRKIPPVLEHDVKVLFGDLNFRISMEGDALRAALQEDRLQDLRAQDQLLCLKDRSPDLQHYKEGELVFAPTFKYARKSHSYDYSKAPAWCDRVLYSGREVQLVSYGRTESLHSCHRPVSATLLVPSRPL
jgi:hypothetical protein